MISASTLASGKLTDATGKVIASLKDLAEAKGDILDENGQVVLAHVDLLRSFVKSDGKISLRFGMHVSNVLLVKLKMAFSLHRLKP